MSHTIETFTQVKLILADNPEGELAYLLGLVQQQVRHRRIDENGKTEVR